MLLLIGIVVGSLAISFCCSFLEACLLSLSLADIAAIGERHPKAAVIWHRFKENVQRPIAVILIINTVANAGGSMLAGAQFHHLYGPRWIPAFSLFVSLIIIQWSEILPKTLGVKFNRHMAPYIAWPLSLMVTLLKPIIWLIQFLNRPFAGQKQTSGAQNAVEDISVLTRFAALNQLISRDQERIVERSMKLSKRLVSDIMVKRGEMITLTTSMSLMDALVLAHIHHHTRFPLVDKEKGDAVIGYVNFKDIVSALQLNRQNPTLRGICRPILEVDAAQKLSAVMNQLIKSYQHIALAKGKAGEVLGVITLEDIVESIVGAINDEYDILPDYCYPISDTRHVVGGGIRLNALRQQIAAELPGGEETLNDWLLKQFPKRPKAEDKTTQGAFTFIVRKVSRSKIREIIVEKTTGMGAV
jgi:CBS domain containing-hemolysin-like protein